MTKERIIALCILGRHGILAVSIKRTYFSKLRALQRRNSPKQYANLKFLDCENGKKIKKDMHAINV